MIKKRRLTIAIIAIAATIVLATFAFADLKAGTKAPEYSLPTVDGKTFTLADNFKKPPKVVVMDIWATWCPPCKMEIPYLIDLSNKYKGKDVTFVGVAVDEKLDTVKKFVTDNKIPYTIAHDSFAGKVGSLYGVRGIPATYIIDKKGTIRFVHSGFPRAKDQQQKEVAQFQKEIDTLLAEK